MFLGKTDRLGPLECRQLEKFAHLLSWTETRDLRPETRHPDTRHPETRGPEIRDLTPETRNRDLWFRVRDSDPNCKRRGGADGAVRGATGVHHRSPGDGAYLPQSVFKVVLQKKFSTHIRQLILYIINRKG